MRNLNEKKGITALICAVVGAVILFTSMRQGAGIGGDATIYITSARNLLAGKGLGLITAAGEFRLIPYFPPFYSLLLAFCGLFTADIPAAALILNLILFAGLIFLIAFRTSQISGQLIPGFLLGMLLAGSPILIPAYSWAMSEPLAIFLGFAGLILLEDSLTENRSFRYWVSAVLLGLSFLTRYSSAAFIAAAVLLIFCFGGESLKKRFPAAFLYGLASVIPMIIWLAVDFTQTRTVSSRSMLSGRTAELWAAFLPKIKHVFTLWFLPESRTETLPGIAVTLISLAVLLMTVVALAVSTLALRKKTRRSRFAQVFFLLSAFSLFYLLLIVYVSLNTYPPITINTRMILPVYVSFFWMLFLIPSLFSEGRSSSLPGIVLTAGLFLFMLISSLRGVRIARQNAIDGLGYSSTVWKNSQTVAYIRENIPEGSPIVTNEETALLFLLDRTTWPMHEVYVNEPDTEYYAYESDFAVENDASRQIFRAGGAFLVIFDTFEDQMADIYGTDAPERIGSLLENLVLLYRGDDGRIYTLETAE